MAARQRKGWERLRGGCGGIWRHVSGWCVCHCGHPTALWPYYGIPPGYGLDLHKSRMLLTGGIGLGRGFARLVAAQAAVEKVLAGGWTPPTPPCPAEVGSDTAPPGPGALPAPAPVP